LTTQPILLSRKNIAPYLLFSPIPPVGSDTGAVPEFIGAAGKVTGIEFIAADGESTDEEESVLLGDIMAASVPEIALAPQEDKTTEMSAITDDNNIDDKTDRIFFK